MKIASTFVPLVSDICKSVTMRLSWSIVEHFVLKPAWCLVEGADLMALRYIQDIIRKQLVLLYYALYYSVPQWSRDPSYELASTRSDINPIEYMWDILERNFRSHSTETLPELQEVLCKQWERIFQENVDEITRNMPQTLQAVIQLRNGNKQF